MDNDEIFQARSVHLRAPLVDTKSPKDGEPDVFLEKVLKWQEERLERQLRGEYRSKIVHLNELMGGNLHTPLRLSNVRIEGAKHTRPGFLSSVISPHLASANESTLESVLHQARDITHALQSTQLFKSVHPEILRSLRPDATVRDVDVVFRVQERGRLYLRSSTEVGNGEASASATVRIGNVFGGAETLEGNVALGTQTRRSFRLGLSAPLSADMLTRGELSIYGLDRDNTAWVSSKEALKGFKAGVKRMTSLGLHEVAFESVFRHIHSLEPTASFSIRQSAGTSLKSSISHSFVHDSRDDRICGNSGLYLKLTQELAGLGGDTSFAKAEAESYIARRLFKGLHISLAATGGLLYPLDAKAPLFNDRFHLGGPTSVRMFRFNSLGPHDEKDALGGDCYWSAGMSLIGNIPSKPHWPLKTHVFLNAGKLASVAKSRPFRDSLLHAVKGPSVAAGVGLIYRFDPVRVEINFGVPLVAYKSDGCQRGFQVGIGLEFL